MPTLMLDALAHEQNEALNRAIAAAQMAIECVQRINLIRRQIEVLAGRARSAPPSIAADASEEEFLQFQAEHFPDLMLGEQDEIRDTPGKTPAIQDDGAGKQGSAASVPGGAETRKHAEVEQVVADVASGEQEARTPLRDDPEAAPDAPNPLIDKALDLHATTDLRPGEIAEQIGSTKQAVGKFLRQGRLACDPRAAAGDLRRQEAAPEQNAAKPTQEIVTPAVPAGMPTLEPEAPGVPLAELDLRDCRVEVDYKSITIKRHEFRIVHLLNDQRPVSGIKILNHASILSTKLLRRDLNVLNPILNQIGIEVHELPEGMFQLRRLQVA